MQMIKANELKKDLVYKTIFNALKNNEHWKLETKTFKTYDLKEACLVQDVLNYFVGGSEWYQNKDQYEIKSKGYYFYIGS